MLPVVLAAIIVILLIALMRSGATTRASLEERDRAFNALRNRFELMSTQREILVRILEGLGEGVLAVDHERQVVLANRRFAQMFNVSGDLVGRPLAEVTRVAPIFGAFDAALRGSEASQRFSIAVGVAERRIEMRAFPLPSADIAAVALFIDVTQIERLEEIRRNFVSDFSHEVRTPLTGLRSAVESFELAGEQMTAEEDHQLRRIMTRQLRRIERLVDDLAELSSIESGALRLEKSTVDLYELVRDLCEDFGDRAKFDVMGEPVLVIADSDRIQQAFSNLIDNAIKYGGERKPIDIRVRYERELGVVSIADHGEGLSAEEKERIFRRFYRVDKSRSQEIAGSGLGLAITKHLVLLHNGTIDVESELGSGAMFIVRLPRA
ncbi:MAG TPA: ATP-binding protein [Thermoanaerobaculia bacterium]|nr:ATP-binding protein [Thermoanaerobaculia bacterium]